MLKSKERRKYGREDRLTADCASLYEEEKERRKSEVKKEEDEAKKTPFALSVVYGALCLFCLYYIDNDLTYIILL